MKTFVWYHEHLINVHLLYVRIIHKYVSSAHYMPLPFIFYLNKIYQKSYLPQIDIVLSSADGFEFASETAPAFCLATIKIKQYLLSSKIDFEITFVSFKVDFKKEIRKQIPICSDVFYKWMSSVDRVSHKSHSSCSRISKYFQVFSLGNQRN